jgi:hypothetical protein
MDPFLENPATWPDVHNRLIAAIGDGLGPVLRPRYVVRLEERTYLGEPEGLLFLGRPDLSVQTAPGAPRLPGRSDVERAVEAGVLTVEVPAPDRVRETYIEVRLVKGGEVVTVLEVLSPANKVGGEGRRLYENKRLAVLATRTNLVEIDLVRAGEPMTIFGVDRREAYSILVSRGHRRPLAELRMFSVREPIPRFSLPLLPGDEEPEVDIGAILSSLYDRAAYDLTIDYSGEPVPPLADADHAFTDDLLRRTGHRR